LNAEDNKFILDQLSSGQKLIIQMFDPEQDFGRPIPPWELRLRITKGKPRIYAGQSYYPPIKSLIKFGILTKLEGTGNYMITKLGVEIKNLITPKIEESIPPIVKERMGFIQEELSKTELSSEKEHAVKAWVENYYLTTKKFAEILKEISEKSQKRFATALALTTWNSFYQPRLISIKKLKNTLEISEEIEISHLNVICQFFQWKHYPLDKYKWFVIKNLNYWIERIGKKLLKNQSLI
jgi:hypothetical protein